MNSEARNRLKSAARLVSLTGLGLLAAGLACRLATPKVYQAAAKVRIENKGLTRAGRLRAADLSEAPLMAAECKVLRSDALLGQVARNLDLAGAWGGRINNDGAGTNAALDGLKRMVQIRTIPETSVIEVRVRSAERVETARIANEVVRLYLADHEARRQSFAEDRVLAIPAQWEKGNEKLRGVQDQFVQVSADLLRAQAADTNVYFDAAGVDKLRSRRIDLETEITAREVQLRRLRALPADELRQVLPSTVTNALLNAVLLKLLEARRQLAVAGSSQGREAPEVREAELTVQELDRHATEIVEGLLTHLESELATKKSEFEQLDGELKRAQASGHAFSTNHPAYLAALREVRLREQERAALESRLDRESLEAVYPVFPVTELVEDADTPTRPSSPDDRILLGLNAAGGLAVLAGFSLLLVAVRVKPKK
jgi:uncharacterized protein involved in exopolysaccharide biosynthesis